MSTRVDTPAVCAAVATIRRQLSDVSDRRISIVAVTKSFSVDAMYAARDAGCDAVGENYAQELVAKMRAVSGDSRGELGMPVHFIGQLQSNKVKQLAPFVSMWQTVDRTSLVREISRRTNRHAKVLIQVNLTGEDAKGGCPPGELASLLARARSEMLDVRGLMTVGPTDGNRHATERTFRMCRSLADDSGLEECSMGMSNDFLVAAECGATMVRLGSVLFGARRNGNTAD